MALPVRSPSNRAWCRGLCLSMLLSAACTSVNVQKTVLAVADQGRIGTLAVAPLDNLSVTPSASDVLTAALVHELRHRGRFKVVEIEGAGPGIGERWTASQAGKKLDADAVLVGTVTAFEYDRSGLRGGATVSPSIGVDLRVVGVKNGAILWAAGVDAKLPKLFSDDGVPLEQLAQKVAERVADELERLGNKT